METLWVNDAEMIRRLGIPEKAARRIIRQFDAIPGSGFPQKSKVWNNMRYWPAVKEFFETRHGLMVVAPQPRRNGNARAA